MRTVFFTLELALKADARKTRWHQLKLFLDVWIQVSLYVFALILVLTGHWLNAFYVHFFGLGFYQLLSSLFHPVVNPYEKLRTRYDRYMIGHLVAFVPCLFLVVPMIAFMLTSSCLAIFYLYITILEFNHYTR